MVSLYAVPILANLCLSSGKLLHFGLISVIKTVLQCSFHIPAERNGNASLTNTLYSVVRERITHYKHLQFTLYVQIIVIR